MSLEKKRKEKNREKVLEKIIYLNIYDESPICVWSNTNNIHLFIIKMKQ